MNINDYLSMSEEQLKDENLKAEIINNEQKYIFVWFCQRASKEQIESLLYGKKKKVKDGEGKDGEGKDGIYYLKNTEHLNLKLNGLLTSGTELNICKNEDFCEMIVANDMTSCTYGLNGEAALSFFEYISQNYKDEVLSVYNSFCAETQINILESKNFEPEQKLYLLKNSSKKAAEFLLNRDNLDLSELTVDNIEILFKIGVVIPEKNYTPQFINRIASIHDVNRYRLLINQIEENIDVSKIEAARKKQYEAELESINENGLLEKFQTLKDKIKSGEVSLQKLESIQSIEGFEGSKDLIFEVLHSKNIDETIKKINDYHISNIIIDYYFKDVPTNVLKNISAMLEYNDENSFLAEEDKNMYKFILNIDAMDAKHKLKLFKIMKEQNIEWTEKFYDNFSEARETMVEQINNSILTKDNMQELYNEELSEQLGVPIYYLNGQKYKVLVRNIGVMKEKIMTEENVAFMTDGSSFSIDGSEMLRVFQHIDKEYTLAYSGVPKKQLIHSFFGDSFTEYSRNEIGIPNNRDSAERIIKYYTPEQFTTIGGSYNELLLAVPNIRRKSNEFEEQLERPNAFAIYCYDEIKEADVESAKRLGLSIILVNTKAYDVDRSNRASTHDYVLSNGMGLRYVTGKKDERLR